MSIPLTFDPFTKTDLLELVDLWNRCFDKPYRVSAEMVQSKILNNKDTFAPAVLVCKTGGKIIGFIACKVTDNTIADYDHAAWICTLFVDKAYRRQGIGTMLLQWAEKALREAGYKKLFVAGELDNFYSGIPNPGPELNAFFENHGFELSDTEHYDLTADVSTIDFSSLPVKVNRSIDYTTRTYSEHDYQNFSSFLHHQFPGRWEEEMLRFIKNGGDHRFEMLLCKGDEIKGFCKIHYSPDNDGLGYHLGYHWGALGPIGIADDIRGLALGNRILCDSLAQLKSYGAHNVNIDWTVLKDFYGQFGFVPWRTYLYADKDL